MDYISLNTILSRGEKVSPRVLYNLMHPLVEFLIEVRDSDNQLENGRLTHDDILFSHDYNNFIVLNSSNDEERIIKDWGNIILKVSDSVGYNDKRLKTIGNECVDGKITSLEDLHLQLERRINRSIYKWLIVIILLGLAVMAIMHFSI